MPLPSVTDVLSLILFITINIVVIITPWVIFYLVATKSGYTRRGMRRKMERNSRMAIERKAQRDIDEINAEYQSTLKKMHDVAGQSWKNMVL